jgi:hypothetical protein
MRNLPLRVTLTFFALGVVSLGAQTSKISQLPDGTFSDNIYSNDALGLRYKIPSGWIATADPKGPVSLDIRNPDGPVNKCSKVLLSFHAPHKIEGRFNSMEVFFAIDPACFPDAEFPHSMNKGKIQKFAGKIVKAFSNTPYILPSGADVDALNLDLARRPIIILTGESVINAIEDPSPVTKEPLHVNVLLCLRESNGYWVAWGALADDASKEELKKTNVDFSVDVKH